MSLDDDCLLYMMRFLSIADLIRLEEVCDRFRRLVQKKYRSCKTYSWIKENAKCNEIAIEKVGSYLTEFQYNGIGNVELKAFSLVGRYCSNIRVLILAELTLDMNLIILLEPILASLKWLEVDKYLLGKAPPPQPPDSEDQEEQEIGPVACMMLCIEKLECLCVGEPFVKDTHILHDYLGSLMSLKYLKLSLVGEEGFKNIANYVCLDYLPLETMDLYFPHEDLADFDHFCSGLTTLYQLKTLIFRNVKNKHLPLLMSAIPGINTLTTLHLICSTGTIVTHQTQRLMSRINNKNLNQIKLEMLQNLSMQFLVKLKWWENVVYFTLANCDKVTNDVLIEICTKMAKKMTVLNIVACPSILPLFVETLEAVSKVRTFNLTVNLYHDKIDKYSKFVVSMAEIALK